MPGKRTAIVIDDDRDINRLIAYNLEKSGFDVVSVFDGLEAVSRLKSDKFDIAIVDIMLPGTDGFNICRLIKEDAGAYKTFVIMVTAKNNSADKVLAHILGADGYVSKPFRVSELVNASNDLVCIRNQKRLVGAG